MSQTHSSPETSSNAMIRSRVSSASALKYCMVVFISFNISGYADISSRFWSITDYQATVTANIFR